MAELNDIMAAGTVPIVNAGSDIQVAGDSLGGAVQAVQTSVSDIQAALADGINLPEIDAAGAEPNSIFYNTDNSRVCWKSHGGLVFRFGMQLV